MAVGRGRRDPLQGRGLGLDARGGAAPAGVGRPRGPSARDTGPVGSRMCAASCSRRSRAVCLFVRAENDPAIRLYEAIGMEHVLDYRSLLF